MEPFAEFLIGMGYPEAALRDPYDGSLTRSSFADSELLAGVARLVLRARRHAAHADRSQPGRHDGHAGAARAGRRIPRCHRRRRSRDPHCVAAHDLPRPLYGRGTPGRRRARRVCVGDCDRRAAAPPARPVVDDPQASQGARQCNGVHGLRHRLRPHCRQPRRTGSLRRDRIRVPCAMSCCPRRTATSARRRWSTSRASRRPARGSSRGSRGATASRCPPTPTSATSSSRPTSGTRSAATGASRASGAALRTPS